MNEPGGSQAPEVWMEQAARVVRVGRMISWFGAGLLIARFVGGFLLVGLWRMGAEAVVLLIPTVIFLGFSTLPYIALFKMARVVELGASGAHWLFLAAASATAGTTAWLMYLVELGPFAGGNQAGFGYIIYPPLQAIGVVVLTRVAARFSVAQDQPESP